jgi:NADPH:quinone reductase-like Zn-dependent oxidoreductase
VKAAWRDRYGGPGVVSVRDIAQPQPQSGQLLVRVQAASVNRADLDNLYPRWQFLRLFLGLRRPRSHGIGTDFSGVVEALGPEVTKFEVGDRVLGELNVAVQGAFAELVVVTEQSLARIPDEMSFVDAACLAHSGVLALQGLRTRSGSTFKAGDEVLIVGASGNVGPFAVQIAKARGARVTGVASTEKLDFVRSLGADYIIDYKTTDPARTGDRYDWILDVDSHLALWQCRHSLRGDAPYIALGGPPGWFLSCLVETPVLRLTSRRYLGMMLWWKPFRTEDISTLLQLVAAGTVKPVIDSTFPLAEVAEALRWVDDGHARGKVVVTMPGQLPSIVAPVTTDSASQANFRQLS